MEGQGGEGAEVVSMTLASVIFDATLPRMGTAYTTSEAGAEAAPPYQQQGLPTSEVTGAEVLRGRGSCAKYVAFASTWPGATCADTPRSSALLLAFDTCAVLLGSVSFDVWSCFTLPRYKRAGDMSRWRGRGRARRRRWTRPNIATRRFGQRGPISMTMPSRAWMPGLMPAFQHQNSSLTDWKGGLLIGDCNRASLRWSRM